MPARGLPGLHVVGEREDALVPQFAGPLVSSPALPELSSHTSATARRCSSLACAAIRARASSSLKPAVLDESPDAKILVGVHDDDQREHRRHLGLDQQRDVLDDHGILGGGRDQLGAPVRDQRVHDAVEGGALVVVAERHRGQRRAVERTVGQQDVLAERVDELGQSLGARLDDLAGDDVAVDDDAAAFAKVAETVDFPAPIPPVKPIRSMRTVCQ